MCCCCNVRTFKPHEISNTAWALAKAEVSHPTIFERVADHILGLDQLGTSKPQELANTVWAFAKAEVSHPAVFEKVADHILSLENLHAFNEQVCSTYYGHLRSLFETLAAHTNKHFDFQDLDKRAQTNMLGVFGKAAEARDEARKYEAYRVQENLSSILEFTNM